MNYARLRKGSKVRRRKPRYMKGFHHWVGQHQYTKRRAARERAAMRHAIQFERHPNGLRLRLLGQRSHHGAWGCLLLAFKRTRKLGLAMMLHDLRDARKWFAGGWQAA